MLEKITNFMRFRKYTTRSLSRDKNFEKNTKTPFFPWSRNLCFLCATKGRKKHKEKEWFELKTFILNEYPND